MALGWDPPAAEPGLWLERWQLSGYRTAGDMHVKQASGVLLPSPFTYRKIEVANVPQVQLKSQTKMVFWHSHSVYSAKDECFWSVFVLL